MADFEIAFKRTERAEGGYANNPADKGGETVFGVSRKANPNWSGWVIVDQIKRDNPKNYVSLINKNEKIQGLADQLYKSNYWDVIGGDFIENQEQANSFFDMAINAGSVAAIKLMQSSLGLKETGIVDADLIGKINHPDYV